MFHLIVSGVLSCPFFWNICLFLLILPKILCLFLCTRQYHIVLKEWPIEGVLWVQLAQSPLEIRAGYFGGFSCVNCMHPPVVVGP